VEEKLVLLGRKKKEDEIPVDDAEVFMSVVVPAYNEEERLSGMLEEAVAFLEPAYSATKKEKKKKKERQPANGNADTAPPPLPGWEILVVSDGSTDKTVETALAFAHKHKLPEGSLRVIALEENRGKGGAVTHGMRHVRGQYAVFADADGASKFDDLAGLVEVCQEIEDTSGRAVAIGSRAHLVGSDAVVKVRESAGKGSEVSTWLLRLLLRPASPSSMAAQLTLLSAAIYPPQHTHACFPPPYSTPYASCYESDQGYPVRLQAVFAACATIYNPLHAQRRLDLRY
jgi:dolichyl-phosphate beta-glucosyltransferase